MIAKKEEKKDRKILTLIRLHLSNENLQGILNEKIAIGLWLRLEQLDLYDQEND